jgi:hypothetical protein
MHQPTGRATRIHCVRCGPHEFTATALERVVTQLDAEDIADVAWKLGVITRGAKPMLWNEASLRWLVAAAIEDVMAGMDDVATVRGEDRDAPR